MESTGKPHAVCIPFPSQGHINPMLKLATLLHRKGFHITFVHTQYNRTRLLESQGDVSLPDFQIAAISDGLPPPPDDGNAATQDIRSLCLSTQVNCLEPLNELIDGLNHRSSCVVPPVSCVVYDMIMSFALDAAERIGVPGVVLQTAGACSFMCNKYLTHLVEKGFVPLKDKSCMTNGYLETQIDWIPGVIPLKLGELTHTIQTTDPNDPLLNFVITQFARSSKAAAIIINSFDALEQNALSSLSSICPPIYTVGPLHLFLDQPPKNPTAKSMTISSLWKEDTTCLKWLDSKPERSVIYVNFGSIAVPTPQQMSELAWGLAGSEENFLWVVRPDLLRRENPAALPPEFREETGERGFVSGWGPQEEVLRHPAVGGFLTHCGWNSVVEGVSAGVPMICWPFFADQRINCRYVCDEWRVGVEMNRDVERDEVGVLVRELMGGERGGALRRRAEEWREKAAAAAAAAVGGDGGGGSSWLKLERLVHEVLIV
ncbi:hypothetical protein ABFS82_14G097300 [Erythranthe guttata]